MFPMGSYPQFSFVLRFFCPRQRRSSKPILLVTRLILLTFLLSFRISAQNKIVWSDQEKPIVEQLRGLRKLDDTVRARTTKDLAMQIRQLPIVPNKLKLAGALAGLSTEGDFGSDTLQEVTTTLPLALREQPPAGKPGSLILFTSSWLLWRGMSTCMASRASPNLQRRWRNWKPTTRTVRTRTSP